MIGRKLIETNIVEAWNRCIEQDYSKQRINSERSLQASFWSHLNKILPPNRRLFIEPRVAFGARKGKKKFYPDIVVCNERQVIAIIELKYLPRGKPRHEKDIKTLSYIATNRDKTFISNKRYRGEEKDPREYKLSKRILFVYACVHKKMELGEYPLYASRFKSLKSCYLQLHAETEKSAKPNVFHFKSY